MVQKVKHIIFILILAMLILPGIQSIFHIFPESELHGEFEKKERPTLNTSGWMSGKFQQAFDPWLEENIGFHNGLVRVNNQLDYTLFHKTHAEGVVRGRNGNLFEYDYIRAWEGKDFVGEKLLDSKLRRFRFLQDHLKASFDIDLVLILEPGKASLYEEDIPDKYNKAPNGKSNYEYMSMRAMELGINLIDLNAWYMQIKDTATYPIFPIQGTHWSEYAMWYAADSLINYIEETRQIDLPDVIRDSVVYKSKLESTDYDQGVVLNLLFELEHGEMPYPRYHFNEEVHHSRPYVLSIADSYYWNIFNTRIPKNLFANEAFWYFYKKVYPDSYFGSKVTGDLDLKAEIEKQDIIFFMTTERFLYMIDRGFVDDLMQFYGLTSDLDRLTYYKMRILQDNPWFTTTIAKADKAGISLGEMLDREADYLLWTSEPEVYYSIYGPSPFIKEIRSDDSWFADIKKKAEENEQDIEERLMIEARYLLETGYPEALKKYDFIQSTRRGILADTSWYRQVMESSTGIRL